MFDLGRKESKIFSKFLKTKEDFSHKEISADEDDGITRTSYPAKNVYVSFLFDLTARKIKEITGFEKPFLFAYLRNNEIYYETAKTGEHEQYFLKKIETGGIGVVAEMEKKAEHYLKRLNQFMDENPVKAVAKEELLKQLSAVYALYLEGRGHLTIIGGITPHIDAKLKSHFSESENVYQRILFGLKSQTIIHENLLEDLVQWGRSQKLVLDKQNFKQNLANARFSEKLEKCFQNGYFLHSGYGGVELWDIRKEYGSLVSKAKEKIARTGKSAKVPDQRMTESQKFWVEVARRFSVLRDERKKFDQKSFYHIAQILEELSKKSALGRADYENLFIAQILNGETSRGLANKQKELSFCYAKGSGYFYAYGQSARQLFEVIKEKVSDNGEVMEGKVACAGKVSGRVRIIQNPHLGEKIGSDEILVAGMTSPDFLPYMKQAKGIITERGGITSHAALISREIEKPCLIDVASAMTKLKNGDYVELDANLGTVRKIEEIISKNEVETRINPELYKVSKSEDIIWFRQANKKRISQVGGKGANLGEMYGKFPVPNGFCVSVDAYKRFMNGNKLFVKINELLAQIDDHNNVSKLTNISGQIQSLILRAPLDARLEKSIRQAYKKLDSKSVAVRSSATAEDLPSHSFAGQLSSFLDIEGEGEVIRNIKKVWASLFTPRVIYYRVINKFEHNEVFVSVIVQQMIQGARSGVMFMANPVTSDRGEVVIEATYGLGESVVSGIATPDYYRLDKKDETLIERKLAKKEFALMKGSRGSIKQVKLSAEESVSSVLAETDLKKLVRIGKKIEKYYKSPQDIEWVLSDGRIFIVQSRSITTLKRLIFVTSNKGKIREAKKILGDLENISFDYDEIQELDAKKVIEAKLKSIKMPGKYFVEDTSLYLDGLNGLPGPFIKWFVDKIGCDGVYKMVEGGNRKAAARTIVGYSDGTNIRYFEGEIKGQLVKARGNKGFGWDAIFQPAGYKKTFAEMTMSEKNKVSMRKIALMKLKEYLDDKK